MWLQSRVEFWSPDLCHVLTGPQRTWVQNTLKCVKHKHKNVLTSLCHSQENTKVFRNAVWERKQTKLDLTHDLLCLWGGFIKFSFRHCLYNDWSFNNLWLIGNLCNCLYKQWGWAHEYQNSRTKALISPTLHRLYEDCRLLWCCNLPHRTRLTRVLKPYRLVVLNLPKSKRIEICDRCPSHYPIT